VVVDIANYSRRPLVLASHLREAGFTGFERDACRGIVGVELEDLVYDGGGVVKSMMLEVGGQIGGCGHATGSVVGSFVTIGADDVESGGILRDDVSVYDRVVWAGDARRG